MTGLAMKPDNLNSTPGTRVRVKERTYYMKLSSEHHTKAWWHASPPQVVNIVSGLLLSIWFTSALLPKVSCLKLASEV